MLWRQQPTRYPADRIGASLWFDLAYRLSGERIILDDNLQHPTEKREPSDRMDSFLSDLQLCNCASVLFSHGEDATQEADDAKTVREMLRSLYAYATKATLGSQGSQDVSAVLKQLYVSGFHAEQIWSQLDKFDHWSALQERKGLKALFDTDCQLISAEMEAEIDALLVQEEEQENGQDVQTEDSAASVPDQLQQDIEQAKAEPLTGDSGVEDAFLSLKQMGEFLDDAEKAEYGQPSDEEGDFLGIQDQQPDQEIEEADSLFKAADSEEEGAFGNSGRGAMYQDMFDGTEKAAKLDDKRSMSSGNADRGPGRYQKVRSSRLQEERQATKETIAHLEEEAIADREWPFRGEISATSRPLNSALEVDLDYDTTVRPPPQPTQADMDSIEELIKRRIRDLSFDDVQRVVPPPIEEPKRVTELDDNKARKGLGDIYADAYVKSAYGSGTVEEKEDKLRVEARSLFQDVCSRVDALTHFHFAPRPVVEDMQVKVQMPTVRMEEGEPTGMPSFALRVPEEVYNPPSKTGEIVEAKELSKQEKKQMRAKRKRTAKISKSREAASKDVGIVGRRSLVMHQKEGHKKKSHKRRKTSEKSGKSPSVFQTIQSHEDRPKTEKKRKPRTEQISSVEAKL